MVKSSRYVSSNPVVLLFLLFSTQTISNIYEHIVRDHFLMLAPVVNKLVQG